MRLTRISLLLLALTQPMLSAAEFSLSELFSDHMVLQRAQPICIFGNAPAGATVTLKFQELQANAIASKDGSWRPHSKHCPHPRKGIHCTHAVVTPKSL